MSGSLRQELEDRLERLVRDQVGAQRIVLVVYLDDRDVGLLEGSLAVDPSRADEVGRLAGLPIERARRMPATPGRGADRGAFEGLRFDYVQMDSLD